MRVSGPEKTLSAVRVRSAPLTACTLHLVLSDDVQRLGEVLDLLSGARRPRARYRGRIRSGGPGERDSTDACPCSARTRLRGGGATSGRCRLLPETHARGVVAGVRMCRLSRATTVQRDRVVPGAERLCRAARRAHGPLERLGRPAPIGPPRVRRLHEPHGLVETADRRAAHDVARLPAGLHARLRSRGREVVGARVVLRPHVAQQHDDEQASPGRHCAAARAEAALAGRCRALSRTAARSGASEAPSRPQAGREARWEDRPGEERLVGRMLSTAPDAREEEESCR
jgi:hypothetical protein